LDTRDLVDGTFEPGAAVASIVRSSVAKRTLLLCCMVPKSSATEERVTPLLTQTSANGLGWGLIGVLAFSFTVPFTRFAVRSLDPLFIGAGRAVIAGILAFGSLTVTKQLRPTQNQWKRLVVVAGGVVFGFPLLTSFALRSVPASHGAVVIVLLPAATAVAAVLRGHERPPIRFWLAAGLGALAAVGFGLSHSGGLSHPQSADLLLFGAVVAAAIGYTEGGLLARELGAWQTVSWALVMGLPLMAALTGWSAYESPPYASPLEWSAFAYLGIVSAFLGFFAWYRGLAIGPMAQVSQTQLVQPVLSICWAVLLLGERITWTMIISATAVILCALSAVRIRLTRATAPTIHLQHDDCI